MTARGCSTVGIDLGTTYSSLAYVDAGGFPRVVNDARGRPTLPSVVLFQGDEIAVGYEALRQAAAGSDQIVQFVKLHMGEDWSREFNGHRHTPQSISALVLKKLVQQAEPDLGPVQRAVITVPAYFTEKRRRATQQAGELAGLSVAATLNEPTAAALAYGSHRVEREEFDVVYDLGGGTFDVTVVRVTAELVEELSIQGNRQLGGRDWDRCLLDHFADDFARAHGIDLRGEESSLNALQAACESAKQTLSRKPSAVIEFSALGREHSLMVTRERFEALSRHLLETTRVIAETAVRDAGLRWSQIARVILVGGSTLMPAVREMVRRVAGRVADSSVNPLLAVSLGAAIYANLLDAGAEFEAKPAAAGGLEPEANASAAESSLPPTESQTSPAIASNIANIDVPTEVWSPTASDAGSVPPLQSDSEPISDEEEPAAPADDDESEPVTLPFRPRVNDETSGTTGKPPVWSASPVQLPQVRFVTSHGVGVLVLTGDKFHNSILIPRNSPVPIRGSRRFFTVDSSRRGKHIRVTVTQGDSTDADLVEILGEGRLAILPAVDHVGRPVEVVLQFDEQGRLDVHAEFIDTGQQMEMTLDVSGGLQEEEMRSQREFLGRAILQEDPLGNDFILLEPDDDIDILDELS